MRTAIASVLVQLSICGFGLAGCSREEPARTVSWYREHPEDRKAMITRCSDDPGHFGQTPNCVNASRAEGQESIGHWKDLPPLDLPLPNEKREIDDDASKVRP